MNECLQYYTDQISSGNHLSHAQVNEIAGLLTREEVQEESKFRFLKELAKKGETDDEFSAFVSAFRSFAKNPGLDEFSKQAIDLCGTGGDQSGTFNISTFVSIVVASSGVPVIKHGNRSISSKCGSADLLEALGIPMETNPQKLQASLTELNFCFLFAPHFHPTFKSLTPVRQSLAKKGVITMFNRLGPCLNPANPAFQILGVYDPSYLNQIARCLTDNGAKAGWVVNSEIKEGSNRNIDELTSCGINHVQSYGSARTDIQSLTPFHWGEKIYPFEHLRGGDLKENLSIFRNLLEGNAPDGLLSTVLINISSALWISGKVKSIEQGVLYAKELIDSGKVIRWLRKAENFFSK